MDGNKAPMLIDGKAKGDEGSSFNIKWLLSTLLILWPWLLGSIIVSLIIGNLLLRYSTPIYMARAEILIYDSKKGNSSAGDDIVKVLNLDNKSINIDNEIEILKSHTTMEKVVQKLHLNIEYSIVGRFKVSPLYDNKPFEFVKVDSSDDFYSCKVNIVGDNDYQVIDGGAGKIVNGRFGDTIMLPIGRIVLIKTADFKPSKLQYTVNVSPVGAAAGGYMGRVIINAPGKSSSYMGLAMTDNIPDRAVDFLNNLMTIYMQNNVESKNRISQSTFNFINARIDSVINELSKVEMDIRNFKQDYKITDMKSESENLYKVSADILDKKRNAEVQVELINAIINYMTKSKDPTITLPANLLENGGIKMMIDKFNALHTEIETSLISTTENNPATKNLIKQQNEIKQNILSMLASTRDNLKIEAAKFQEKSDEINGRIHQVPEVEMKYLDYSRRETLKNDMYVFLLKKREETAIEMSATQPNAAIIDSASFAGQIAPDHARILMMSFLFGLAVPFGVIVLRRALNIKIISKADVTKLTTIPVIGEIGNNSSEDYVAVTKNSRSIISEQFRALRTNLQYLLTDKKEKVLMVTSSMGGEGKSFIAVNMAITLAMSGKRVVLVEMDLRKPKISKMLNLDNSIGFSNYAIGRAEIDDVIVPSGVDANLYVLGSGPVPPNPSELILLPRTEEMFRQLREKFDYVIVDTSPVGMVTDAQLINKYADTAIYIIRQGLTYKQQLNIPNELYHSGRIARLSIVINDVLANRGFAYGYGYEEGYGYSYGNGYGYGYGYGYGSYGNGYYLEERKKGIKDWLNLSKNK